MVRLLFVGIWVALVCPSNAATMPVWTADVTPKTDVKCDPFQDVLDAHALSYRDTPGPPPMPLLQMSVQLPLLMGLGWWITLILPRQRSLRKRNSSRRLRGSGQIPDTLDHRT